MSCTDAYAVTSRNGGQTPSVIGKSAARVPGRDSLFGSSRLLKQYKGSKASRVTPGTGRIAKNRKMDLKGRLGSSVRRAFARIERTSAAQGGTIGLACIVLLSLAFRLHLARDSSLWLDEVDTHFDVLAPWSVLLYGPSREQPPLMFVLVRLATYIFGTGEAGLRSVSLFFGCVLLVAVYELCLELGFTVWRSLIVVATLALTPFFIWHATEARMYAILIACTTLATTRTLRALRGIPLLRDVIGLGVSAVAAAATQYFGLAYAFALLGAVAISLALRWRTIPASRRAAVIGVLLVCLVPLGYLTHRAAMLGRFYAVRSVGMSTGPTLNLDLLLEIWKAFSFLTQDLWRFVLEPGLVVIGLVLLSMRLRGVARTLPLGLGLAPCVFALFLSGQHFIAARYLSPSLVFYHLGACTTLFAAVDGLQRVLAPAGRVALLAPGVGGGLLIGLLIARMHEYPDGFGVSGEDYRGCQRYFLANLARDTALVTHPGSFGDLIFGREYNVGSRPISLEKFRPRRGINRYLIVELHSNKERQAEVASLVEQKLSITSQAWSSLPLVPLPDTTYQPAVRAHIVQLPDGYVPPPRKKRQPRTGHP